ncbi:U2A'/phosphoprotein 32 family A C-terminal domain-containing protein [Plasmodiophora brassicae]
MQDVGYAAIAAQRRQIQATPHVQRPRVRLRSPAESPRGRKRLSDVLTSDVNPERRVSVAGKGIGEIDRVDPRFHDTEVLLLGNNLLTSVDGIEQFPRLSSLSLANNLVADLSAIGALSRLRHLHSLYLDGCPVVHLPNYRCHVIALVPSLANLDSTHITPGDRSLARTVVSSDSAVLSVMTDNERKVRTLEKACYKLLLHAELIEMATGRHGVFNRVSAAPDVATPIDADKFVNRIAWTMDDGEDPRAAQDQIRQRIQKRWQETYSLSNTTAPLRVLHETWECASSEVFADQQGRLTTLVKSLQNNLAQVHQRLAAVSRRRAPGFAADTLQSELRARRNSPTRRPRDNILSDLLEREPKAAVPPVPSSPPRRVHLDDENSRVRQLEELLERVGDRLRVFQQQNLDNVQRAEQETAILTQEIEQHRATNAGLQQHINEIGSERHRLLTVVAGGVSDEVARAELQAAVSARDASVRASLDREQALQSEIAALRAQLLRRDIACSAIGSMHLDRTELDVERDLRHGRPIGEDAIRRLVQELRATRDIAETFRQELAKADGGDAEMCVDGRLASAYARAGALSNMFMMRRALRRWCRTLQRTVRHRRNRGRRDANLCRNAFISWATTTRRSHLATRTGRRAGQRRMWAHWKAWIERRRKARRDHDLRGHWVRRRTLRECWRVWAQQMIGNPSSKRRCELAIQSHEQRKLRMVLFGWRRWTVEVARPKRCRNLTARYFGFLGVLGRTWATWKTSFAMSREDAAKSKLAWLHRQCKLERAVFVGMRRQAQALAKKRAMRGVASQYRLARILIAWHGALKRAIDGRVRIQDCQRRWRLRRTSIMWAFWRGEFQYLSYCRWAGNAIREIRERSLSGCALRTWMYARSINRILPIATAVSRRRQQRRYLGRWTQALTDARLRHRLTANADEHAEQCSWRSCHRMMRSWVRYRRARALRERTRDGIGASGRRRRLARAFRCWRMAHDASVLAAARAKLDDLEQTIASIRTERDNVASEARRHSDTIARLRGHLVQQSTALAQKDESMADLHALYSKLQDEIDRLTERESALSIQLVELQGRYNAVLSQKDTAEWRWDREHDLLVKASHNLETVISRHQRILSALSSILAETTLVLSSTAFDSVDSTKEWMLRNIARLQDMLDSRRDICDPIPYDVAIDPVKAGDADAPEPSLFAAELDKNLEKLATWADADAR